MEEVQLTRQKDISFDFVDLGLSVCWATCNMGATTSEQSGFFFSWGESVQKMSFKKSTYKFYVDENEGMKNAYGEECDAAHSIMGNGWRLPTKTEVEELFEKCERCHICRNGVNGVLFTSRINGMQCFFPECGSYGERGKASVNVQGYYWTATQSFEEDMNAVAFYINKKTVGIWESSRIYGYSIRPVKSDQWNGDLMFQSKEKKYPESQYFLGYRKSGPKLTAIYYSIITIAAILWGIVCLEISPIFRHRIYFLVLIGPPAFLGFVLHSRCFRKDDINNS